MEFFAYIDPGTGSLFVQAIIGVAAGTLFFFRNSFGRIGSKLKQLTNSHGRAQESEKN